MSNFSSTVCTYHGPVDAVIHSVLLNMPSFHGLTTRLAPYIAILAAAFMSL